LNIPNGNLEVACEFDCALLKALCAAQIPLEKLENPELVIFMKICFDAYKIGVLLLKMLSKHTLNK
jgi:hypothetical protein